MAPHTDETRFRGVAAITLDSGELAATFLPGVGHDRRVAARRWARAPRPARRRRAPAGGRHGRPAAARAVGEPARRPALPRGRACPSTSAGSRSDRRTGLPIHGFLAGVPGWRVDRADVHRGRPPASGRRSTSTTGVPVPPPHRPGGHRSRDGAGHRHDRHGDRGPPGTDRVRLAPVPPVDRRAAPAVAAAAAGAPPPRARGSGIPTGAEAGEPAEAAPIGRRTFDDLYALGSDRRLALRDHDGRSIELRNDAGYPYAQVWVPAGSRTPRSSRWLRRRTRSGRLGADGRARRVPHGPVRPADQLSSSRSSLGDDPAGRLDQREVRERLREVPEVVAGVDVELLGVQPER